MKLELDAKIQIENTDYEVAELVNHFINLSAMEISDFFTHIKFFIPKRLKIDVLKDVLLEPVLELRRQKLTVADERKYRLSWFQSYSEYQLENLLYTLRDQSLNEKFLRKLWHSLINYMVNAKLKEADFARLIAIAYNTLQQLPDNILKYNLELNRVFLDAKGELDGLKPEVFRPVLYKSATILEIRELGKKYNISIPQRLNKDQFHGLIIDTLRKKGKYNNKVQLQLEDLTMTELQKYCLQYKLKLSADLNKEYIIEYILEHSPQTNDIYVKPLANENVYNYEPSEEYVDAEGEKTIDTLNANSENEQSPYKYDSEQLVVEKIIIPKKNIPVENYEIRQERLRVKLTDEKNSDDEQENYLYKETEINEKLETPESANDDIAPEDESNVFTASKTEDETNLDASNFQDSDTSKETEENQSFEQFATTNKEEEFHNDEFIINSLEEKDRYSTEPSREELARIEHNKIMKSRCKERLQILDENFQNIHLKYEKLNEKVQLLKQTKDCEMLAQNFTVLMNLINDFKASGEAISHRVIEISVEFQEFFDNEIEFYKQKLINNINSLDNELDNDVSILENLTIYCEEQAREDEIIKQLKASEGAVYEKNVSAPDVDQLDTIKAQYNIRNNESPTFDFVCNDAVVEVTNFSKQQAEINRQKEKDFIEDLKPHRRQPVTFTPFNKEVEPEKTPEEIDQILRPVNSTRVDEKFDLEAIPKGDLYSEHSQQRGGDDDDEYLREFYAQTQKLTRKERKQLRQAQREGKPINMGPTPEIGTTMKLAKKPYGSGLSKTMKIVIGILVPLIIISVVGFIIFLAVSSK